MDWLLDLRHRDDRGRFGGDSVSTRVGDRAILFWGGLVTIGGFALVLLAPTAFLAMSGFLLIGLGASNIVPVLFRGAGKQHAMPAGLAVAAITTAGYAGNLVGPAVIGFVAKAAGFRSRSGCSPHLSELLSRARERLRRSEPDWSQLTRSRVCVVVELGTHS